LIDAVMNGNDAVLFALGKTGSPQFTSLIILFDFTFSARLSPTLSLSLSLSLSPSPLI
jgi:hypothetical protein